MPRLSIRQSPRGAILCLAGKWQKHFGTFSEVERVVGVELTSLAGEVETDINFLDELPPIQHFVSLYSVPLDYSRLYRLPGLKSIKFITLFGSQFDFEKLQHLESAVVPWHEQLDSIFRCSQLRH